MVAGESFVELLKSPGHWYFEIFLMVLFDFVIGVLLWQRLIKPHIHRDVKHAGHAHDPHEEHVAPSKAFGNAYQDPSAATQRIEELEKGMGVAMYHLNRDDSESAWQVLVDLVGQE